MNEVTYPPPRFDPDRVATRIRDLYRLEGKLSPLPSERDQNFLLQTTSGGAFVVKIANRRESPQVLEMQNRVLFHLRETASNLCFPEPLPSRREKFLEEIRIHGTPRHLLRILTYLPGRFLADIEDRPPALLKRLGRFIGTLDRALAGFHHPAAHRRLLWDLKNAGDIRPFTVHIGDRRRRHIVEHHLDRFTEEVLPRLSRLPAAVIHNDANDHNLLVRSGRRGAPIPVGLIDFGDMVHSQRIHELAIAAAYAMMGQPEPLKAAAAVVAGYRTVLPLQPEELDVLFTLINIRLCISVSLSAFRRAKSPGSPYLFVSEGEAWKILEHTIGFDPEGARRRLSPVAIPAEPGVVRKPETLLKLRRRLLSGSMSIAYRRPLKIVRGFGQYLYDHRGRAYLDCVNNVCHVGHCHPEVVAAARRQMAVLNTNTRYLHDAIVTYAERLLDTFPPPLAVCFFVCTGSEANELALRLARSHSGSEDIIVLDQAYHGNTSGLVDISPYKHDGPGGRGAPPWVHKAPLPDIYRGPYHGDGPDTARRYAAAVRDICARLEQASRKPAAFIAESLPGVAGQIVLPSGYLETAYRHVRAAGGVCIADEVQVGFGRVGTHFWGFETQGVVPDIVTLGKPMGNGHPLAAVITTADIARSFETGMEYFNTFGGNPVSCEIGLSVLRVIEEEGLQAHAARVGDRLKSRLSDLMRTHSLIGDVRGLGLYLGVELVRDRHTREPAAEEAADVIEGMKHRGILLSVDGPLHNVLKIKPPLPFNEKNGDSLAGTLDAVLSGSVQSRRSRR